MNDGVILTPKYLTKELAAEAIAHVLGLVMDGSMGHLMKRHQCHIVVLVPGMEDARDADFPDWPIYPIVPVLLCEASVGKADWKRNYQNIAKCKALQIWTGRNDGRPDIIRHLVFPGDTPYWGGVFREGIATTCSGVDPWFDKMIAGMVTDVMIAMAHDAYEKDPDRKGVDFLK